VNRTLLKAHVQYQLQRHGWLAATGLLLLLLALGLQLLWVDGLHARNATLREELGAQRQGPLQKRGEKEDATQRQATLYASLPESANALEAIGILNQAAARNQVSLLTAEYRVTRQGSGPLLRYQVNVPLRADYVHLHAWLSQVMNALPNAALDDLTLKRDNAGLEALDARMHFTVNFRAPSAAAEGAHRSASDTAAVAAHPPSAPRLHHSRSNPFSVQSWLPPVAPVKAPLPPAPSAPPLPFTYLGKMQDGPVITVFVSQGGRNHVLHNGDNLAGYRVEDITPTDMTFVYLPLNEKQRLTFGSEN
jgi:hypothetical protein